MLTERTIINALILLATFILAPFIVAETLSYDYVPALVAGGIFALIVAFFVLKDKLSVCPLLGCSIQGSLNFLPAELGASQIAIILLIVYYIAGFVLLTQRPISVGRPALFWPILALNAIVLYHVHALSFGALGGNSEGAKSAFLIYIYTFAYFCGINLPTPSVYFLSRIPLYAVCLTGLSSIPYLLSTFIPSLAPLLYSVTDNVNVEAYVNTKGGTEDVAFGALTSKLIVFGPLSAALQQYLLAYYPIGTWFSPKRFWVPCLSLVCFVLAIFCGFRSNLSSLFILTFIGIACYYSWRALAFPAILLVGALMFISASENNIIHLPLNSLPFIAQRTLSFLPGDWDPEAIQSGKDSNEFRQNIIDVYLQEYAGRSPFFGNGFELDKNEIETLENSYDNGTGDRIYLQSKIFIETKTFHTGWVSVYDCVGLVGWIVFLGFQLAPIYIIGQFLAGRGADRRSSLYPLYVWIQMSVTTSLIAYYTVFGSFSITFVNEICFLLVIGHLCKLKKQNELASGTVERKNQVEFSGISQANYGNKYY